MLTESDVAWIKANRKEITKNRTRRILIEGESKTGEHPITGEPVVEPIEKDVQALVTEITSAFKFDVGLVNGVEVEKGDLWVVIDLDELDGIAPSDIKKIEYLDEKYRILAADREGIGIHNRVTIVARKIS